MQRLVAVLFVCGFIVLPAVGQEQPLQQMKALQPVAGVPSNQVQVLAPAGDSLWSGPLLTVYVEEEERFLGSDHPLLQDENVVFSLATESASFSQSVVWAGLAYDAGENVAGAGGFLVSTDGGRTFEGRAPQLDGPADTTVVYGASTLSAVPITQEAESAPQGLAIGPDTGTVWVAGGRSGLRRSTDQGQTWQRMVLPPDTTTYIHPDSAYTFTVAPPLDDGRGFRNYSSFSVLVDETGTVWVGTAAGLNRSTPNGVGPSGERAWRRFAAGDSPNRLTGNGVVALTEQPRPNRRSAIWMATWALGEQTTGRPQRFGVTMTPDGGETFRQPLLGARVFDLAARTDRVYAAADAGLFVSGDQGQTWRTVEDVRLQNEDQELPSGLNARAVAVTPSALWVGTTDGLLRLDRGEEGRLLDGDPEADPPQWRLFRTEVPVNPEEPTEQVPDVETYAYPNPFIRSQDQVVRIAYELDDPGPVEVNIYDFGMNRVRTLRSEKPAGQQETVWDGTDEAGLRLPTGTYLYTVKMGNRTARGKIVIAE